MRKRTSERYFPLSAEERGKRSSDQPAALRDTSELELPPKGLPKGSTLRPSKLHNYTSTTTTNTSKQRQSDSTFHICLRFHIIIRTALVTCCLFHLEILILAALILWSNFHFQLSPSPSTCFWLSLARLILYRNRFEFLICEQIWDPRDTQRERDR